MHRFIRKLGANSLVTTLTLSSVLSLVAPTTAIAAPSPNLGAAESFSILAQTAITSVPTSVISGDVGMNSSGASITGLTAAEVGPPGLIYATDLVAPSEAILDPDVQADALATYTVEIPGFPIEGTPIPGNLDGVTRGPGVYDLGAGLLAGGTLTLDGPGVYIFRTSSTLTSSGTVSLINGARACDVYWRVTDDATINGSAFVGTILAGTGIHFGANVTLDGRALAVGGDVTLISDTISGPSCAIPPTPTPAPSGGGGGGGGTIVRPIIDVVKVPSPSALPAGPGSVTYTFTVRNTGPAAMTNVTLVDDSCTPSFVSGDTNDNETLEVSETWTYTCSNTLSATHTNNVTATGWANGFPATDVAAATVTVGGPVPTPTPISGAVLPGAGFGPEDTSGSLRNILIPAGLFLILLSFFVARKKQVI